MEENEYKMEKKKSIGSEVGNYDHENLNLAIHEVGEDNTTYGEFISTYFAMGP